MRIWGQRRVIGFSLFGSDIRKSWVELDSKSKYIGFMFALHVIQLAKGICITLVSQIRLWQSETRRARIWVTNHVAKSVFLGFEWITCGLATIETHLFVIFWKLHFQKLQLAQMTFFWEISSVTKQRNKAWLRQLKFLVSGPGTVPSLSSSVLTYCNCRSQVYGNPNLNSNMLT